jgi:transcriptional regulator with XRE-family HTH domain
MTIATADRVRSLVEDFGGQAEVARALGVDRSRITRWLRDAKPDADNRRKLESIEFAMARLLQTFHRETAVSWLYGLNAHIGDRRPIDLLAAGRVSEVLAAIEAEETGAYA